MTTKQLDAEREWRLASAFWKDVGDPCPTCGAMSVGPVLVGGELVRACVECGCREGGA